MLTKCKKFQRSFWPISIRFMEEEKSHKGNLKKAVVKVVVRNENTGETTRTLRTVCRTERCECSK
jgi:hypothetical protein